MGHWASDCRSTSKLDGTPISSYTPRRATTSRYNPRTIATIVATSEARNDEPELQEAPQKTTNACYTTTVSNNLLLTDDQAKPLINHSVTCNGTEIEATIDTGSQLTLVNAEIASNNNWNINNTDQELRAANGDNIPVIGKSIITIAMDIDQIEKKIDHPVIIAAGLPAKAILGLDLLEKLKISVDISNRRLSFAKNPRKPGIRTMKNEVIPPRSVKAIQARINAAGLIMTVPFQFSQTTTVANSIAQAQNNKTDVLICNVLDQEICIKDDTQVANYVHIVDKQPTDDSKEHAYNTNLIHSISQEDTIQISDDLNETQQKDIIDLISRNIAAFSINGNIGLTDLLEHEIELNENARPHAEPLRRRPYADRLECRKQVNKLLTEGFIEESKSPWAAAYVLAKKKNGEKRLCIDFRKLNEQTKKVVFPLPNIEDCLDTLSGKHYFSTVDMASGFWQIPMEKKSKEMTAFRTEDGLWHFNVMPFGLTNAPASFQRMVNALLSGLSSLDVQAFIDDICIATNTWEEHLETLDKLFKIIIKAKLKLKGNKCLFGAQKTIFLGHEISRDGIKQDHKKLAGILKMPAPTDKTRVKQFLGMSSYYRKFVPNFAQLSEPLTRLTRKDVTWKWTDEEQSAFEHIKESLAKDATLAHFNHRDPIMLKTDASRQGIAGILLQKQQDDWRIVTCCSRRLSSSEANYGITDLEGLAIVYSVQKLRPYLLGKPFEILTDHCALCVLNTRQPQSARLKRWAIVLSEFDYKIRYTKGDLHQDVDCLSRAPVEDNDEFLEAKVYAIYVPKEPDSWSNEYTRDEESLRILAKTLNEEAGYKFKDDLIYRFDKLYAPPTKRDQLLKDAHNATVGHGGIQVTLNRLKQFFWPNMAEDVKNLVNNCDSCQIRKARRTRQLGQMYHHEAYQPLAVVAIDTMSMNQPTRKRNSHIIVAIDVFTKYIATKALPTLSAEETSTFLNEYVTYLGIPGAILTDNAPEYKGEFAELLETYGIEDRKSSAGHSQGNAVCERAIQTVQDRLGTSTIDEPTHWDEKLPITTYNINSSYHSTTRFTPYELMFGREAEFRSESVRVENEPENQYAYLVRRHVRNIHQEAESNIVRAQQTSRPRFEASRDPVVFEKGQQVLTKNTQRITKIGERYIGPFEVVSRDRDIYTLRDQKDNNRSRYFAKHVSTLKPYSIRSASVNIITIIMSLISFFGGSSDLPR